jgi:hypothetical protein
MGVYRLIRGNETPSTPIPPPSLVSAWGELSWWNSLVSAKRTAVGSRPAGALQAWDIRCGPHNLTHFPAIGENRPFSGGATDRAVVIVTDPSALLSISQRPVETSGEQSAPQDSAEDASAMRTDELRRRLGEVIREANLLRHLIRLAERRDKSAATRERGATQ